MSRGAHAFEEQWRQAGLWRGRDVPTAAPGIATGHAALDRALPDHGWPLGGLIEILGDNPGAGGLRLLMPALAGLSQTRQWLAWVTPPLIPYAPALTAHGVDLSRVLLIHPRRPLDALWAAEQALRSGTCSAVLVWAKEVDARGLRRLQLAAEEGGGLAALFRPAQAAAHASPAPLRLHVAPTAGGVEVNLIKSRGAWASGSLRVDWHDALAVSVSPAPAAGNLHARRGAQ